MSDDVREEVRKKAWQLLAGKMKDSRHNWKYTVPELVEVLKLFEMREHPLTVRLGLSDEQNAKMMKDMQTRYLENKDSGNEHARTGT